MKFPHVYPLHWCAPRVEGSSGRLEFGGVTSNLQKSLPGHPPYMEMPGRCPVGVLTNLIAPNRLGVTPSEMETCVCGLLTEGSRGNSMPALLVYGSSAGVSYVGWSQRWGGHAAPERPLPACRSEQRTASCARSRACCFAPCSPETVASTPAQPPRTTSSTSSHGCSCMCWVGTPSTLPSFRHCL